MTSKQISLSDDELATILGNMDSAWSQWHDPTDEQYLTAWKAAAKFHRALDKMGIEMSHAKFGLGKPDEWIGLEQES